MKDIERLEYIAALAAELMSIARQANRPVIVYLLNLVIEEARRR